MTESQNAILNELAQLRSQYKAEVPGARQAWPESVKSRIRLLLDDGMTAAKVLSDQLESILRDVNKSALESYLEAKDDLLAMHDIKLSRDLKKFFSTTNPIKSLNSLLEEDMRRVKHWKNSEHFQKGLVTFFQQ